MPSQSKRKVHLALWGPSKFFDPSLNHLRGVLQHLLLVLLSLLGQLLVIELDVGHCPLASLVSVGAWAESEPHNSLRALMRLFSAEPFSV